jgi:hypothetical protein
MPTFTLQQGKRYRATIALAGLERWASNEMIAAKLREAGFDDVKVSGEDAARLAEASWPGPDRTADLPSQVQSIAEMSA